VVRSSDWVDNDVYKEVEAADGRMANNNVWNRTNGMGSNTW
jgi:hypothetical protein